MSISIGQDLMLSNYVLKTLGKESDMEGGHPQSYFKDFGMDGISLYPLVDKLLILIFKKVNLE